ncbi:MAG: VCBS repeat-containing protein [Cyclobacteriaceae bacterium]|nr:VCBS repeat-containing protein [Cyclobacteriaceae bacterium]
MSSSHTGIDFSNDISESREFNIINYQDFYSGGGVSIGDINNDGLVDVFFTGNMVQNRLYINKGEMHFEDITETSGLLSKDYTWSTGSTMVDINNDGWLDIYVCYSGLVDVEQRRNKLWVNQKDNTFIDEAKKYHIDDAGYAVNANFFDYDKDGDLDMYLVNQGPEKIRILIRVLADWNQTSIAVINYIEMTRDTLLTLRWKQISIVR